MASYLGGGAGGVATGAISRARGAVESSQRQCTTKNARQAVQGPS